MTIEEQDLWWFKEIDECLWNLSDDPHSVISRMGNIIVAEDIANDYDHFYGCIILKYGEILEKDYSNFLGVIDGLLSGVSKWDNNAFALDLEWLNIRKMCRDFLLNHRIVT